MLQATSSTDRPTCCFWGRISAKFTLSKRVSSLSPCIAIQSCCGFLYSFSLHLKRVINLTFGKIYLLWECYSSTRRQKILPHSTAVFRLDNEPAELSTTERVALANRHCKQHLRSQGPRRSCSNLRFFLAPFAKISYDLMIMIKLEREVISYVLQQVL